MLKAINKFISLFLDTFKLFGRVKAWLLLLCIVAINWTLLLSHDNFTHELSYGVISWWTQFWAPQYAGGFTHYPGHFILLAYYYSYAKLFIGLVIEGGVLGAVAVIFYRHIFADTEKLKLSFKSTLNNWMHLTLGWIILNGLLTLGHFYIPKMLSGVLLGSPRRQMAFEYGLLPSFDIIMVALFFFTIPYIAIYRTNVLTGIKNSFKLFIKHPIYSLFLSFSILSVPIILSLVMNDPGVLVEKFNPSIVYWLLLTGIFVDLFVNFFWMGTAVNFLSDEE